jgi:ferredoxin-type protein NapH
MKKSKKKSRFQEICCRKPIQIGMTILLPLVIVGGYFYPKIGFTVVGMITLFMVLSSQRGRFYCGWLCPMGAFHERVLSKISFNRPIPPIYKTTWFRWVIFVLMMGFMLSRLWAAGGNAEATGTVFRTMWVVSMGIAIGLGVYFKARVWCILCPMGSLQGVASKHTYVLSVDDSCVQCKLCKKVCPVDTYPGGYKAETGTATVPSIECLRCFNCVNNCPKGSLSFIK